MTELEKIWDELDWERKFKYVIPDRDIVAVFRESEAADAQRYFARHRETTQQVVRAAWLYSDSIGQALAVTEGRWEE